MIVTIDTSRGCRMIGEYLPERKLFVKRVRESRHLFQKMDAWGIDAKYFTDVLLPNKVRIVVYDTECGMIYISDAETYGKKGRYFHFKGDEDHASQIFLSRRHFESRKAGTVGNTKVQKQNTLF